MSNSFSQKAQNHEMYKDIHAVENMIVFMMFEKGSYPGSLAARLQPALVIGQTLSDMALPTPIDLLLLQNSSALFAAAFLSTL